MFGRRPAEPLNGDWSDAALERAVEQALDVEPTPEFLARVRTHVAEQPSAAYIWRAWRFRIAAAALVSTCTIAALRPFPFESRHGPVVSPSSIQDQRLVAMDDPDGATVDRRDVTAGTPIQAASARTHSRAEGGTRLRPAQVAAQPPGFVSFAVEELRLPEVVISPNERRALDMLLNPAAAEATRAENVPDEIVIPDLPALSELEVPAVDITPLAQIAMAEGVRP